MKEFINTKDFYLHVVLDRNHIFLTSYKNILRWGSTPPCVYLRVYAGGAENTQIPLNSAERARAAVWVANDTPAPGEVRHPSPPQLHSLWLVQSEKSLRKNFWLIAKPFDKTAKKREKMKDNHSPSYLVLVYGAVYLTAVPCSARRPHFPDDPLGPGNWCHRILLKRSWNEEALGTFR